MNKQELKEAYKQRKARMGVFQVKNTANDKIFIGSSLDLDAIWNRIRTELKFGGHRNELLQQDWNKYGEESFVYEVLGELKEATEDNHDYKREAKQLEEMFIEEAQPFGEKGYNKQ